MKIENILFIVFVRKNLKLKDFSYMGSSFFNYFLVLHKKETKKNEATSILVVYFIQKYIILCMFNLK